MDDIDEIEMYLIKFNVSSLFNLHHYHFIINNYEIIIHTRTIDLELNKINTSNQNSIFQIILYTLYSCF